jgi:hypothetical protein
MAVQHIYRSIQMNQVIDRVHPDDVERVRTLLVQAAFRIEADRLLFCCRRCEFSATNLGFQTLPFGFSATESTGFRTLTDMGFRTPPIRNSPIFTSIFRLFRVLNYTRAILTRSNSLNTGIHQPKDIAQVSRPVHDRP